MNWVVSSKLTGLDTFNSADSKTTASSANFASRHDRGRNNMGMANPHSNGVVGEEASASVSLIKSQSQVASADKTSQDNEAPPSFTSLRPRRQPLDCDGLKQCWGLLRNESPGASKSNREMRQNDPHVRLRAQNANLSKEKIAWMSLRMILLPSVSPATRRLGRHSHHS